MRCARESEHEETSSKTWPPPPPLEEGIVPSSLFGFDKLVFFFHLKGYYCCMRPFVFCSY
jgi:hypothetical protein